ncbi:MAG TPA: thiamine pyrophosphate-binding protein, partial [Dehalococcoidia bacterium]|nr:thiamine pyrophosphate-binding protein [Dehalococcoidia bacterium]
MGMISGNELFGKTLKMAGIDTLWYITGAPMGDMARACIKEGIRGVDVRHEQAAAMAAHAWARLTRQPGACSAASGPGMTNLITGISNAFSDAAPLIAMGGASSTFLFNAGDFQELDQLAMMKPTTKWADRILDTNRIPEFLGLAYTRAMTGCRGPVYLDVPGDVVYGNVDEDKVRYPTFIKDIPRPMADPAEVRKAAELLRRAERPVLVTGSGVHWSDAGAAMERFVNKTGIPFYTTPISRGSVPEDNPRSFLAARNTAFREADVILVVGTRFNFIIGFGKAPRFNADAKVINANIDPTTINHNRGTDAALIGDARMIFDQLTDELSGMERLEDTPWINRLRQKDRENSEKMDPLLNSNQTPIHPLRLCKEVRDFLDRDAILVVDGHVTLNFARQSIPTHASGHRLNAGPFGTMGVAVPFGMGAKVAKPDTQVLVLSGDGSFGFNGLEYDTCVRHNIPLVTVVVNNGGWAGGPGPGEELRLGQHLGYSDYHKIAEIFGA